MEDFLFTPVLLPSTMDAGDVFMIPARMFCRIYGMELLLFTEGINSNYRDRGYQFHTNF